MPKKEKLPDEPRKLLEKEETEWPSVIRTIGELDSFGVTTLELRWILGERGSSLYPKYPKDNILLHKLAKLLKKNRATKEDRKEFLEKLRKLGVRTNAFKFRPQRLNTILGILKNQYAIIDKIGDDWLFTRKFHTKYIKRIDQRILESIRLDDIISYHDINFYGLKYDVFDPRDPDNLEPITPRGKWAKKFKGPNLSKDDIFDTGRFIGFEGAYRRITEKLLELKVKHRVEELQKSYKENRKSLPRGAVKLFLSKYSKIFLTILNAMDWQPSEIKKAIHAGIRPGTGYKRVDKEYAIALVEGRAIWQDRCHTISLSAEEYKKFSVRLNAFSEDEKNEIINFLVRIRDDVADLHLAGVMVTARAF